MVITKRFIITMSGLIWLVMGVVLMSKGLQFLVASSNLSHGYPPLIAKLTSLAGGTEQAALFLIVVALFLGFVKGRGVLAASAKKSIHRICSLEEKISFRHLFTGRYLLLMALMIGMGRSMTYFNVSLDIRGFIDVVVGSALIHGALSFTRFPLKKRVKN